MPRKGRRGNRAATQGSATANATAPNGRRRNRRRRQRQRGRKAFSPLGFNGGLPRHEAQYLAAIADPFSQEAKGARVPAFNAYPSAAFYCVDQYTLASDAAGNCVGAWRPRLFGQFLGGSVAGVNITWNAEGTATNASIYTGASGVYAAYRVVQLGVRIRPLVNLTQTGGRFFFGHVPDTGAGGSGNYPTTSGQFQSLASYGKGVLNQLMSGRPLVITSKMVDVDAVDYRPFDSATADGWADIVFFFNGGTASIPIFDVEVITLLEGTPRTATSGLASQPALPYSPATLSAALAVSAAQPAGVLKNPDSESVSWISNAFGGLAAGAQQIGEVLDQSIEASRSAAQSMVVGRARGFASAAMSQLMDKYLGGK